MNHRLARAYRIDLHSTEVFRTRKANFIALMCTNAGVYGSLYLLAVHH